MSWKAFLPPDPNHRTEAVVGIARALADAPHDTGYHGVMADALSDAGAEAEAIAHRIAANPDRARDLMHDSPDLHATGTHLASIAEKLTMRSARLTDAVYPTQERNTPFLAERYRPGRAAHLVTGSLVAGDPDYLRERPGHAAVAHADLARDHAELATTHEAGAFVRSSPRPGRRTLTPVDDGVIAAHERAAELHRHAAAVRTAMSHVAEELDSRLRTERARGD